MFCMSLKIKLVSLHVGCTVPWMHFDAEKDWNMKDCDHSGLVFLVQFERDFR